jgi:hypothetical protein
MRFNSSLATHNAANSSLRHQWSAFGYRDGSTYALM